ncbi:MAG: hypothetical protein Ct9H300mP1_30860 [Planctomycetaceae bacterium]|nr:MAG: hypothetical protein Ct9H300mP1_30860 [Planctomycetaceae bacterium]
MVQIVPFFESDPLFDLAEDARGPREIERPKRVVGGLVVEQVAESRVKEGLPERLELVKDHVASSLSNSMRHERLFGMKLWRFLGRSLAWLEGRNRLKAGLVVGAIVVAGLVLALVPWDYRVEATGQLMPVAQQDIFAPNNGKVIAVEVKGGQEVEAGDVLVVLQNLELDAQIETVISEQENNRELLSTLRAQYDRAVEAGNEPDMIELSGRIQEAEIQQKGLVQRFEILDKQRAELTVRAVRAGKVATFQVGQKLLNRPVNRGEKLLEVMEDRNDAKWRLELQVEEHRVGHIRRHQLERKAGGAEDHEAVPVEFVLATASEKTYQGRLTRMSTRADASPAGGSVIELHVEPTGQALPEYRIGAEVNAKVHCGQRSLFYVLFGDVVEFIRKRLWLYFLVRCAVVGVRLAFSQFQAGVQPHPLVGVVSLFFLLEQFAALLAVLSFKHFLGAVEELQPTEGQSPLSPERDCSRSCSSSVSSRQRSNSSSSERKNWKLPGSPCRAARPINWRSIRSELCISVAITCRPPASVSSSVSLMSVPRPAMLVATVPQTALPRLGHHVGLAFVPGRVEDLVADAQRLEPRPSSSEASTDGVPTSTARSFETSSAIWSTTASRLSSAVRKMRGERPTRIQGRCVGIAATFIP